MTLAMGAAIFFCRAFPFLFFRGKPGGGDPAARRGGRGAGFMAFVEKAAPPAAMTALALNALAGPMRAGLGEAAPALAAAAFTALLHLWRRSALLSIFAGTALYMALARLLG